MTRRVKVILVLVVSFAAYASLNSRPSAAAIQESATISGTADPAFTLHPGDSMWIEVASEALAAKDIIMVDWPFFTEISVFIESPTGIRQPIHSPGRFVPEKSLLDRREFRKLPAINDHAGTVKLFVQNNDFIPSVFRIALLDDDEYAWEIQKHFGLMSLYFSFMLCLLLFGLITAIATFNINYVMMCGIIGSIIIDRLSVNGLLIGVLSSRDSVLNYTMIPVIILSSVFWFHAFSLSFLQIRMVNARRLSKGLAGFAVLSAIAMWGSGQIPELTGVLFIGSQLSLSLSIVGYLIAAAVLFYRGNQNGPTFLAGMGSIMLGSFVFNLTLHTNLFSEFELAHYGIEIGSIFLALVFQVGLIQDFRRISEETIVHLKNLNRLKDEFLANTSHELRTPLNGIIGISESLLSGVCGTLDTKVMANLDLIAISSRRLAGLVDTLLDHAKLKKETLDVDLKPADVAGHVRTVVETMHAEVHKKPGLRIDCDFPEDLPLVMADEGQLQQILYNLVGNAIKFTKQGQITVGARNIDEMVEIYVADEGIGIAPEKHEAIFNSFEQADGSTQREYGGTGLGLTITKSLVQLMGGTMRLESELGKGATFYFTLKIAAENAALPVPEAEPDQMVSGNTVLRERRRTPPDTLPNSNRFSPKHFSNFDQQNQPEVHQPEARFLAGLHVLVVDDDEINLHVIRNILIGGRGQITTCLSGPEALHFLDNNPPPNIVLLDIMMPQMSGYEVCERIRKKYSSKVLPVIYLTAKNHADDLQQGFESGGNDYLVKPINRVELLNRMKHHLELSKYFNLTDMFVPHDMIHLTGREDILDLNLGDSRRVNIVTFFSDIRSFTNMSEKVSSEDMVKFINSYFGQVVPIIQFYNGMIDKFIGDAVMAIFDHPDNAALAAVFMFEQIGDYNKARRLRGRDDIAIGVGFYQNDVNIACVGSDSRLNVTFMGDAVNVAARLESLSKNFDHAIVTTRSTSDNFEKPYFLTEDRETTQLKGREAGTDVAVVDPHGTLKEMRTRLGYMDTFTKARAAFEEKSYVEALELFRKCAAKNDRDYTVYRYSQLLMQRMAAEEASASATTDSQKSA